MNDKLKEISMYDGWEIIPDGTYRECHNQTIWFGHGGSFDCYHDITAAEDMKYLTSLDWLHPVAMKVLGELCNVRDADRSYYISSIRCHCSTAPINGEYTDLFNATYDAIIYLKNQSK